jgi:hypothetical protein
MKCCEGDPKQPQNQQKIKRERESLNKGVSFCFCCGCGCGCCCGLIDYLAIRMTLPGETQLQLLCPRRLQKLLRNVTKFQGQFQVKLCIQ